MILFRVITEYLATCLFIVISHDCFWVEGNTDTGVPITIPEISKLARLFSDKHSIHHRHNNNNNKHIIVVGSANADTFLSVLRLPVEGENLTTLCEPSIDIPGGKGCTQAVAAAKLLLSDKSQQTNIDTPSHTVTFIGQFGNDNAASGIQSVLQDVGVNIDHSGRHKTIGSGRGYVFTAQDSGAVSAVVSGGANIMGWKNYELLWDRFVSSNRDPKVLHSSDANLEAIFSTLTDTDSLSRHSDIVVMLQREIPEAVNLLVATYCHLFLRQYGTLTIVLDGGGEDRPISSEMLKLCDYIMPNEIELQRLARSFAPSLSSFDEALSCAGTLSNESVVTLSKLLLENGARNVLVTRGKRGSTFVSKIRSPNNQDVHSFRDIHVPASLIEDVVDETGAGDCYRSGFVVACLFLQLPQNHDSDVPDLDFTRRCMAFASAAGAVAVTRYGAVPATPSLEEVIVQLDKYHDMIEPRSGGLRGGGSHSSSTMDIDFPYDIGSRLNSMKDRSDLWASSLKTPKDYVKRQASINGLTCVDFNYPQHFHGFWSTAEAKAALYEANLVAGSVCLRYEASKFARGAMNHPDPDRRQEAIQLTKDAAQTAIDLGCNEVVVWSAFDGYDYPFQVDYDTKWQELVEAFQECCDAYPMVKFSVEYKPTDENTRFFTVPSTGAAMLMVHEVNRPNFGLTLDVGHMLMSGENPGQSIAMVGRAGKLFGIQLNDGYTRLAAEDGLMFGSVHPRMALEIMYQLQKSNFAGHIYFDTFPQRSDPIKEAQYNIQRVKAFWKAARKILREDNISTVMKEHDAIGALELIDTILLGSEFNVQY